MVKPKVVEDEVSTKRYNLALPKELFDQVEDVATQRHLKVAELIRRFIGLGLLAVRADETTGSELLIREDGKERSLLMW